MAEEGRTWCFAFLKLEDVLCNVNTQALLMHKENLKQRVIEALVDKRLAGQIGSNGSSSTSRRATRTAKATGSRPLSR